MEDGLKLLERERCSAILRTQHAEAVEPAMRAAVEGGFRVIEFTLNTPGALDAISSFSKQQELYVGAGTVLDVEAAEQAKRAGARFLVAPNMDPGVIRYAKANGLLSIPGTATPTEMVAAHRAGADLVKLFPGPANGPAFVKACLGPLPFLRILPTSGVTLENAAEYLASGAFAVGFVACLFEPEDMAAGRFDAIRGRARAMVEEVRSTHPV